MKQNENKMPEIKHYPPEAAQLAKEFGLWMVLKEFTREELLKISPNDLFDQFLKDDDYFEIDDSPKPVIQDESIEKFRETLESI